MCGLVGFVQRATAPEQLAPMLARLRHRGPDAEGTWFGRFGDWFVALGHRRLSILDIEGGAQPMSASDGSTHIVYNGELYNFRELRDELERRGVSFRTRSDTEVLLHHSRAHWKDGLRSLNGMFAFATWDQESGRLLLARDRAGIKPLYYGHLPDGGIVFASELTAVLQHRRVGRTLCPEGLQSYFFSDYVHPPLTLVKGIKKLGPGQCLEWRGGEAGQPAAYWILEEHPPRRSKPGEERALADELWSVLERSVRRQLVADVPVGVFLSGGIDSSSVAALAQAQSSRPIQTFSIGFSDPTFDESQYARAVAKRIGSRHVEERFGQEGLLEIVDSALASLDEPLADPSYLPTYLVSRVASSHVKVVLGGDGGDELMGGYPTYRAHQYARWYAALPKGLRSGRLNSLVALMPQRDVYQSIEWKLKRFTLRWDDDATRRHLRWMSGLDVGDLGRALPSTKSSPPAPLGAKFAPFADGLNGILALDFQTYLPGSVLTKVDRASMAHGLEVRPPMLDNEFIDWAFSIPSSLKLHRGRSKYLLKLAAKDHLPGEILARPKKGFGIPLDRWMRGPLRGRVTSALASSPIWASGLLDRDVLSGWAQMHDQRRGDYAKPLWAMLVLDEWVRRERLDFGPLAGEDRDVTPSSNLSTIQLRAGGSHA
jgi:asparagine synthase (glutamine-hydrolysing)